MHATVSCTCCVQGWCQASVCAAQCVSIQPSVRHPAPAIQQPWQQPSSSDRDHSTQQEVPSTNPGASCLIQQLRVLLVFPVAYTLQLNTFEKAVATAWAAHSKCTATICQANPYLRLHRWVVDCCAGPDADSIAGCLTGCDTRPLGSSDRGSTCSRPAAAAQRGAHSSRYAGLPGAVAKQCKHSNTFSTAAATCHSVHHPQCTQFIPPTRISAGDATSALGGSKLRHVPVQLQH
jgi:hypothetical protein